MSATVCYIQRAGGGALIRSVRLAGAVDGVWTAPENDPAAEADADRALAHARAAAQWICGKLRDSGRRQLDLLTADPDGALCLWLAAPSGEPAVVAAAIMNAVAQSSEGLGASSETTESTGLFQTASEGLGLERSLQALVARNGSAPHVNGTRRGRHRKASESDAVDPQGGARGRLAVLSVPDAPLRVLIDELDRGGCSVAKAISVWHAMAIAWDPSASGPAEAGAERLVESQSPPIATVLLDPSGRLLWSWSSSGELLAAGLIRLREVVHAASPGAPPDTEGFAPDSARRVEPLDEPLTSLECGQPEVSRLVMDWLGWAAQLGVSPVRIAVIGPAKLESVSGLAEVARAVGLGWNSATIDAVTIDDPIGATLERLARAKTPAQLEVGGDDPQTGLIELTNRPVRAHRRWYQWASAAVLGLALAIGALGYKLTAAASSARAQRTEIRSKLAQSLKDLDAAIPGLSTHVDPAAILRGRINELASKSKELEHQKPVLAELSHAIDAIIAQEDKILLESAHVSSLAATVTLVVQRTETGPLIVQALRNSGTQMNWAAAEASAGARVDGRRWIITGTWKPTRSGPGGQP